MTLAQRLINAATLRGLNEGTPIYVTVDRQGVRVSFVVSYSEPFDVTAPLDVVWVQVASETLQKRQSRSSMEGFVHSWMEVDESDIWQEQLWDIPRDSNQDFFDLNSNVGNPFLLTIQDLNGVSLEGGQLTGPLYGRELENEEDTESSELVRRSFVDYIIAPVRSLAVSVFQQLTSVRNSVTAVRNRTTVVEQRLDQLEVGVIPTFNFNQTESLAVWEITHNLNGNVMVTVWKPNGERVLPSSEIKVDANTLLITFFLPMSGTASIVKVG